MLLSQAIYATVLLMYTYSDKQYAMAQVQVVHMACIHIYIYTSIGLSMTW